MKNPIFSKTLQGILLLLLPRLLKKCGIEFSDGETQSLVELLCDLIGGAWATYGRFKADEPLKNPVSRKVKGLAPLLVWGLLLIALFAARLAFSPAATAALLR